jgi:hypothetical protein
MLSFDEPSHVYTWKGAMVPGVTTVIRDALGNPFERVAADVLEHARQRGSAVHKACELDDAGMLDESTVDRRIVPYVDAWRAFRQQFQFQVLFAETPLYSVAHGFAGTPDCAIALLDGAVAVLDRKTGLPGPAAAMQTAAYAHLVDSEFDFGGIGLRRFALRMLPTGQYRIHEYTNPGDWRDFLAALTVYRLKERIANE